MPLSEISSIIQQKALQKAITPRLGDELVIVRQRLTQAQCRGTMMLVLADVILRLAAMLGDNFSDESPAVLVMDVLFQERMRQIEHMRRVGLRVYAGEQSF